MHVVWQTYLVVHAEVATCSSRLARKRMQLVQQRSIHVLLIETQIDQQRGAYVSSYLIEKL